MARTDNSGTLFTTRPLKRMLGGTQLSRPARIYTDPEYIARNTQPLAPAGIHQRSMPVHRKSLRNGRREK
jgi:hypothetical protein